MKVTIVAHGIRDPKPGAEVDSAAIVPCGFSNADTEERELEVNLWCELRKHRITFFDLFQRFHAFR